MIGGGKCGGNTRTGLRFERRVNILALLKSKKGYGVHEDSILYDGTEVAKSFKKNALYKYLESRKLNYRNYISKCQTNLTLFGTAIFV